MVGGGEELLQIYQSLRGQHFLTVDLMTLEKENTLLVMWNNMQCVTESSMRKYEKVACEHIFSLF